MVADRGGVQYQARPDLNTQTIANHHARGRQRLAPPS